MACNLLAMMDTHRGVGERLEMAYIIYSTALVADSWLDIPGVLLCSGGNSTVSAIFFSQVLFI